MALTNRLLLFLILSHALLLAGFSGAVYALARVQLYRQMDERNEAALDALAAAAESEEDGWEWEPRDRRIGRAGGSNAPIWAVYDDAGRRLDGAGESNAVLAMYSSPGTSPERMHFRTEQGGERWRVSRRVVPHAHPEKVPDAIDPQKPRYRMLVFVAGAPQSPVESVLATLAWSLGGVTVAVLALVALGGRWWCRRALAPVARMTAAAKGIGTDFLNQRVPVPTPHDELRGLAEEFNALLERVQVGYERQARFTAEASHQLRTPLAGMLGQLELALKRNREPEEYRRAIALAVGQADHLNRIVEMLLFLARADGDARIPSLEMADLVRLIADHLDSHWRTHPRFADIAFRTVEAPDVRVRTHPALLGQAIQNIVENALKYSDAGSQIAIDIARVRDGVEISIRDSGRGISESELGRIFSPFYRAPDAAASGIGGVGLGLAVAKRIVESLGGAIRVESKSGAGSTFAVIFPSILLPLLTE